MFKLACNILVAFLIVVLPLQGLSAVLMPLHCLSDEQHGGPVADAHQRYEGVGDDHGKRAPEKTSHDGHGFGESGHTCCDHVSTGAPSAAALSLAEATFTVAGQSPSVLPPIHRERLLRPPRS